LTRARNMKPSLANNGTAPRQPTPVAELRDVLNRCRGALASVAIFSVLINVLALTGSIYMLQLYDRIIPAHSVATLIALSILVLVLFAANGILDVVRARIMNRIGLRLDRMLAERVFDVVLGLPLRKKTEGDGLRPLRDIDQLRSFI